MNLLLLFSIGYVIPTLEIHLLSYDVSNEIIVVGFVLFTFSYTIFSFFGNYIFQKLDARMTVFIGINVLGLGYLMLSPWTVIFPKHIIVVMLSLPTMGVGAAMIYRNLYIVPTFPNMINNAVNVYGYAHDDILTDSLSSLSNICRNVGEIIGPIFAGTLIDLIGYEDMTVIVAFSFFAYGIIYFIGSGVIFFRSKKSKIQLLD